MANIKQLAQQPKVKKKTEKKSAKKIEPKEEYSFTRINYINKIERIILINGLMTITDQEWFRQDKAPVPEMIMEQYKTREQVRSAVIRLYEKLAH